MKYAPSNAVVCITLTLVTIVILMITNLYYYASSVEPLKGRLFCLGGFLTSYYTNELVHFSLHPSAKLTIDTSQSGQPLIEKLLKEEKKKFNKVEQIFRTRA